MVDMTNLSEIDILIRLSIAFAAGFVIGIERSSRRQVAGLRTHILICIGAACLMILSIYLPGQMNGGDPGRIAAQVVAGMGFLGAGAIIKLGNTIRGLTTAASLWVTAAIGLTIGAGMFLTAGIVVGFVLITLIVMHFLERKLFPEDNWK